MSRFERWVEETQLMGDWLRTSGSAYIEAWGNHIVEDVRSLRLMEQTLRDEAERFANA